MRCSRSTAAAIFASVGGLSLLGRQAERRAVARWADNDDPLNGRLPRFPPGEAVRVVVDDGAVIHTLTAGSGPRVVLVHGLTSNIDDLGPIAEDLITAGFSVTGIDQRGHGSSTVGTDGFGARRQARDLATVLARLDLTEAVLVGHSMGGITALMLATDGQPDAVGRLRGLVAIAAPTSLTAWWQRALNRLAALPRPKRLVADPKRLRLATRLLGFGTDPSLFMVDEVIASLARCSPDTERRATLGLRDYDITQQLHRLDIPTLIVTAGSDRIVAPANSLRVLGKARNASAVGYPGAGHMLIWERHCEIAKEIADFANHLP